MKMISCSCSVGLLPFEIIWVVGNERKISCSKEPSNDFKFIDLTYMSRMELVLSFVNSSLRKKLQTPRSRNQWHEIFYGGIGINFPRLHSSS
jgi:hypothetical protein